MFNSVEELENQVKEFQENILASNKLVAGIDELTRAVKQQQKELSSSLSGQISKLNQENNEHAILLSTQVSNLCKENEEQAKAIESVSKKAISEVQNQANALEEGTEKLYSGIKLEIQELNHLAHRMTQDMQSCNQREIQDAATKLKAEILLLNNTFDKMVKELEDTNARALEVTSETILSVQKEYLNELGRTQEQVHALSEALNQKYQDFLDRLEKTNVDQLFKLCQDLKSSVEKKFYVLLGGLCVAIVLIVLSLLLH